MPMSMLSDIHDGYIDEISAKIKDISGREPGLPVFLHGATYLDTRSDRARITVNCIFCNSEGVICADLYRFSRGGYSEIFSGQSIRSIESEGLSRILSALKSDRWTRSKF